MDLSQGEFSGADGRPERAAAVAFVEAAAAGRNGWWRYGLGIVVIVVTVFGLQTAVAMVALAFDVPVFDLFGDGAAAGSTMSVAGFAVIMLSIGAMLPATLLAVKLVHRRPPRSLFTGRPAFGWRACGRSAAITLATIVVLTAVLAGVSPGTVEVVFEPRAFFVFLPVLLLLVPLQVVAEEVLFRGYILQAVARMSRRWWLRLLIPAAIFTLVHIPNNEFQTGGLWAAADYTAVALYLGYLALRGGGLEHAIGVHLGLNTAFFALVGLGVSDFRTPTVVLIADLDFRLGLLGTVVICAVHYGLVMRRSG